MNRREYHKFITSQVEEIKKYILCKKSSGCDFDENLIALEWIEKNAKNFWENWKNKC